MPKRAPRVFRDVLGYRRGDFQPNKFQPQLFNFRGSHRLEHDDGQKSILGSFSCCLVPPEDMSDPMRAGQAESSTKALDLLRRARQCPEQFWPVMRQRVLERVDQLTAAVKPGANASHKSAARAGVAQALDRARAASDVEFAMEKDSLAKALKGAIVPAQGDAP